DDTETNACDQVHGPTLPQGKVILPSPAVAAMNKCRPIFCTTEQCRFCLNGEEGNYTGEPGGMPSCCDGRDPQSKHDCSPRTMIQRGKLDERKRGKRPMQRNAAEREWQMSQKTDRPVR